MARERKRRPNCRYQNSMAEVKFEIENKKKILTIEAEMRQRSSVDRKSNRIEKRNHSPLLRPVLLHDFRF